jgi:processive 1,2-diacylglycerol beta-glucosyltransferase
LPLDRQIVLVVGGGLGIGVEETTLAALAAAPDGVQIVVVCGRNEVARQRLAALGVGEERLQVHGYLPGLVSWMSAADLVATKPGGLSVSEALALGRPLLLTRPIPGAEEGNTRAVMAEGAALVARTDGEIREAFARVFGDAALLASLSETARRIGRADSAARVVDSVAARLPGRQPSIPDPEV